eukprot:scaffold53214_cov14-Tisochrysis_lutea.AAC.1
MEEQVLDNMLMQGPELHSPTTIAAVSQRCDSFFMKSVCAYASGCIFSFSVQAGLNHIHLLPLYDFGSVPEWEEEQLKVE